MEEGFVDESHRARARAHTHTGPPMEEGFVDESYVLPAVTRSSPFPPPPFLGGSFLWSAVTSIHYFLTFAGFFFPSIWAAYKCSITLSC